MLQRVPPREILSRQSLSAAPGNVLAMDGDHRMARAQRLHPRLDRARAGEYAVRGGIVDLFAPGMAEPVRLDFFGDTLESIRSLRSGDPAHHRPSCARSISCRWRNSSSRPTPSALSAPAMSRPSAPPRPTTRSTRRSARAAAPRGMEHWLPLFHEQLETLFDYLRGHAARARAARRGSGARAARADRRLLRGAQGRARSGAAAARPTSRCRRTGSISPKTNGARGSSARRWRG